MTYGGQEYAITQRNGQYSADGGRTWAPNAQEAAQAAASAARAEAAPQPQRVQVTEQEALMSRAHGAYTKEGAAKEPYYTDVTGRKWTESQLAFVDPAEAAALRQAASTGAPPPKITTYAFERKEKPLDVVTIALPPTGPGEVTKKVRGAPETIEGLEGAAKAIESGARRTAILSGISAAEGARAAGLSQRARAKVEAFNKKWEGRTLTATQAYQYTKERQALEKEVGPLQKEIAIAGAHAVSAKAGATELVGDVQAAIGAYGEKREAAIPKIAEAESRRIEMESTYEARRIAEAGIATPGEVVETTARGVVGGAGYGLILAGGGWAPWSPLTVAGGALAGGIAGVGYEAGQTAVALGIRQIAPGSKEERMYLTAHPVPKFQVVEPWAGPLGSIAKWVEKAPTSPTTAEFIEAKLRGKDTYKEYELFSPAAGVLGLQVGAGLLGSVAAVEGATQIAAAGAPKLAALRNAYQVQAQLEGEFKVGKETRLATGETQVDITVSKGEKVLSTERLSVGRGERVKVFAEEPAGLKAGVSATKSDVAVYRSGEVPKIGEQYDFSRYVSAKGGGSTEVYAQTASVGAGPARLTEARMNVMEIVPGRYYVQAEGLTKPISPFKPTVTFKGEFGVSGISEAPKMGGPGTPESVFRGMTGEQAAQVVMQRLDVLGPTIESTIPSFSAVAPVGAGGGAAGAVAAVSRPPTVGAQAIQIARPDIAPGSSVITPEGTGLVMDVKTTKADMAKVLVSVPGGDLKTYSVSRERVVSPGAPAPGRLKPFGGIGKTEERLDELRLEATYEFSPIGGPEAPTSEVLFVRPGLRVTGIKGAGTLKSPDLFKPTKLEQAQVPKVAEAALPAMQEVVVPVSRMSYIYTQVTPPTAPAPTTPIEPIVPAAPPLIGVADPGAYMGRQSFFGKALFKPPKGKLSRLSPRYSLLEVFEIEATTGQEARHPLGLEAERAFDVTLATGGEFTRATFPGVYGKTKKGKKKKKGFSLW